MSKAAPRSVCVFCGSSPGSSPGYMDAALALGRRLGERGIRLVYGGAKVGLMGQVADAALHSGGSVVGVIPRGLRDKEIAHDGLAELHVVDSMHQRKALMADLSDAFIALPGGLGTLDELFEMLTWSQLGLQAKPCGLLDVSGFYLNLIRFLDDVVSAGFISPEHRRMLVVARDPDAILNELADHTWEKVAKSYSGRSQVDPEAACRARDAD